MSKKLLSRHPDLVGILSSTVIPLKNGIFRLSRKILAFAGMTIVTLAIGSIFFFFPQEDAEAGTTIKTVNPQGTLSQGLVGWWTFDGADVNATQALDRSGYYTTGTFSGATAPVKAAGKMGQGFRFDGVDDYIAATPDVDNWEATNQFSFGGWLNTPESGATDYLIGNGKGYNALGWSVSYGTGGIQGCRIHNGTTINSALVTFDYDINTWHHVFCVLDGENLILYLDGVVAETTPLSIVGDISNGDNFCIGKSCSATTYFKGKIDDIRLYNRAITAFEIKQLYKMSGGKLNKTSPVTLATGLTGWWKFDDLPAYGSALGTDMDMETAGVAAWTAGANATLTKEVGMRTGGTGTNVLHIAYGGSNNPTANQTILTANRTYRITGWARGDGGNGIPRVYSIGGTGTMAWGGTSSATWQYFDVTWKTGTANTVLALYNVISAAGWTEFDDVVIQQVTALGVMDASVSGNNGMRQAGVTNAIGRIGQAMKFDGVDDAVDTGTDMVSTGADSVCAWIKPNSIGESTGKIVTNNTMIFTMNTNNTVSLFSNGSTAASSANNAVSYNKWSHVCATRNSDGTATNLYINGVLSGTANQNSGTPAAGLTNVFIGNRSTGDRTFDGLIDDVRTYSRVLTPKEIMQLYKMGGSVTNKANTTSSLVPIAWWTFDGSQTGSTYTTDKSVNGRNGALTAVTRSVGKVGQSFTFNGTTSKIDTSADYIGTGNVTACSWIYAKGYGGDGRGRIIVNGKFYFSVRITNKNLTASSDGATFIYSANNSILLNKWYHACVTRNTTGIMNFYVNGALSGTPDQSSGAPAAGTTNVIIGNISGGSQQFDGKIDDVRVYDRILSVSEIKKLYQAGK